jgi:hypothetical protein
VPLQPAAKPAHAPQTLEPHQLSQGSVHRTRLGPLTGELHGFGDQRVVEDDVRAHLDSIHLRMMSEVYRRLADPARDQ